ncbi:MAG: hypothetical protein QOK43_2519 [Acidimicrobiaceae bacterium]|nr:hypothetical protein [Acidimicrobiaceae bacterium]
MRDVAFADDSTGQVFTRTLQTTDHAVEEQRVRWQFASSADAGAESDCPWRPARTVIPQPSSVGAHWTSSVSCRDATRSGPVERTEESTADVVRTDSFSIAGRSTAVYVVKRVSVTRSSGHEQHDAVEDWYAPSLGIVVKQTVESTSPSAAPFARDSTTEWWIVGPV